MELPLLYSFKNNKFRIWSIKVTPECEIVRTYGQEDGVQTVSVQKITSGKNIGKKNETTPYEQACAGAMSMFRKQKVTAGYSEIRSKEPVLPLPMLAHSFDKRSHRITYPAFVQPKIDGVRMITAFNENGEFVFLSRTGKSFGALKGAFEKHLGFLKSPSIVLWLDGELFSSTLTFEEIVSTVRNEQTPDPKMFDQLEYHVYDIIPENNDMSFHERHEALRQLSQKFSDKIKRVPTYVVHNADEVIRHHDNFVKQGYEGVMIRNRDGPYVYKRSYDLQKYKNFRDDEFVIVDIKEAIGNDAGTAILQCKTNNGSYFWVRPRGSKEYRAELLRNKEHILYKLLTVRYQNLTDKNIPRFPVGTTIRDYE